MHTNRYTLTLLLLRDDAPVLTEEQESALQDAHMAHLSLLHERGELLAAGPVLGAPDRNLRGFGIYRGDVDRVRTLTESDPAVRAGRYRTEAHPWMVPAGIVAFSPGRLPASMAEATR
ncbi:MAG TPA: YciI family protein [Nakamurella sp.]|jgi:uncharacterized protein YciI|nr:YciI family protein [Nakamurella sp.]